MFKQIVNKVREFQIARAKGQKDIQESLKKELEQLGVEDLEFHPLWREK